MSSEKDNALRQASDLYDEITDIQVSIGDLLTTDVEDLTASIKSLLRDAESAVRNVHVLCNLIEEIEEDGE